MSLSCFRNIKPGDHLYLKVHRDSRAVVSSYEPPNISIIDYIVFSRGDYITIGSGWMRLDDNFYETYKKAIVKIVKKL